MKKKLLVAAAIALTLVVGGAAIASTIPGEERSDAATLRAIADRMDARASYIEQLENTPPTTVTATVTVTQTVTATPTPTTTTPPPTTTTPPPTTTTTTTPPPPPPSGFPTRQEALARPNVVVLSGTRTTQYKPAAATDVTYDFRGLTSTAYPFSTSFPLVIEGSGNVVVGGKVLGQQGRNLTWAQTHDVYGGSGLRLGNIDGYEVSYDFRVDNVVDGIDTLPKVAGVGPAQAKFLIDGAYMTWIRDDSIEDDTEMSGTIRDILIDGTNDAISIGQSSKNVNSVVNVVNALFIHAPMPNDRAPDGMGHQTLFKQAPGGTVNLTNVTDCMYENPITPSRIGIKPAGTWTNVTFVLGPGWVGANPAVPAGASVSRDWQGLCVNAANSWKAAHGY